MSNALINMNMDSAWNL